MLRHGTVAHTWAQAGAQAQVHNVDVKCDHKYYTALHNLEIQECERTIYDHPDIRYAMFAVQHVMHHNKSTEESHMVCKRWLWSAWSKIMQETRGQSESWLHLGSIMLNHGPRQVLLVPSFPHGSVYVPVVWSAAAGAPDSVGGDRTKQIIGLKLGSCFFLLPAAAACLSTNNLITELGSARSHTETNTHTHLQIPALSVKELPSQLSLFVVPLILRPFGGNRGSVVWLVSCL